MKCLSRTHVGRDGYEFAGSVILSDRVTPAVVVTHTIERLSRLRVRTYPPPFSTTHKLARSLNSDLATRSLDADRSQELGDVRGRRTSKRR